MPSFWEWKIKISSALILLSLNARAQESVPSIEDFKNKKVFYLDVGYNSAPFKIDSPYGNESVTLKYKNNFKTLLGIGFAYKWFHLRIGFPVFNYIKPVEEWGATNQFNVGLNFTIRKFFFDLDFKTVQGYAVKNYASLDSSFVSMNTPQRLFPEIRTTNFSLNGWYFNDRDFKMSALRGMQAHYNKPVHTWYVKGTMNIYGLDNNEKTIIPTELSELNNDKTQASTLSAFDFGLIPGYAYVNRIKNWQFSGWLGIGGVIQSKFYVFSKGTRGFLGLAPRYDIRLLGGYSDKKFFAFFVTEFDNKSIRFSDLKYNLNFYSIKIMAGIRLGN
tara:strand:+ start:8796 stop:9788 length:993 start_codon:yes stop_codon:yes gene_type:complete